VTISDESAVELLRAMVEASSPCGEEDRVAAIILDAMGAAGFEAHRDEVGNVVGEIGSGDHILMVLGHMDTAPGIVPVNRRGNRLYGRGTVDAKGPLAAGIVAAARAAGKSRARLVVIGAVQEEGPSIGARHLAQDEPPDLLIIGEPSNWDAVTLGYKGSQRFESKFTCPSAHTGSPEPTTPELAVAFWQRLVEWCASFVPNATREFDRLTPKLISMTSDNDGLFSTASLHLGLRLPPGVGLEEVREGVADLAAELVNQRVVGAGGTRPSASRRARPVSPDQNVSTRAAVRRGVLHTSAPPWEDVTHPRNAPDDDHGTCPTTGDATDGVLGGRMQYPPTTAKIEDATPSGETVGATGAAATGDIARDVFDVTIDFAPGEPAVRVERRGPLVSAFLRAIRAEGGEPRFKVKTGTSDWNVVASRWHCPAVAYGPGNSSLDHTPIENIELDEYLRGIRVLTHVMEEV